MMNWVMDDDLHQEPEQSIANHLLSTFIAAVGEDEALSDVATRLKSVLLVGDTVNEALLRQAIFGDDS